MVDYQLEIFIVAEVLSAVSLLLFGFLRYVMNKRKLSIFAIFAFLVLLILETLLVLVIYQETKEVSTFQIVIALFVVYACTFGVFDFLKLDRWMRQKIGKWRGVELLTAHDYVVLKRQKDPKFLARKYRITSMIHLAVFIVGQFIMWSFGTESFDEILSYLSDFSWVEAGIAEESPYPNEMTYSIGIIWTLVFVIDFIYSWSYTFFPKKAK